MEKFTAQKPAEKIFFVLLLIINKSGICPATLELQKF